MENEEKIVDIIETISTQLLQAKMEMMKNINGVNLSPIHFQYIHVISKLENPSFTELSQELKITKPTVTAFINKLLDQKIIKKTQSERDKRSFKIKLTKKGEEIARIYESSLSFFANKLKNSMSANEFNQLTLLLEKAL